MGDHPKPADLAVGANIRAVRKLRGISQERLAEACGITFQQIQKYERAAKRVSASMLMDIARALSVRPAELLPPPEGGPPPNLLVTQFLGLPGAVRLAQTFMAMAPKEREALGACAEALQSAARAGETTRDLRKALAS